MLINNLATILTERQLKITKVANDTHISRTTLTSLFQNDSKMIQLETINTLCQYLKITPGDFFEYVPYDFDFSIYISDELKYDPNEEPETHEVEAYLNVKGVNESKSFTYKGEYVRLFPMYFELSVEPKDYGEKETVRSFFKNIPQNTFVKIKQDFETKVKEEALRWSKEKYAESNYSYQAIANLF